MKTKIVEQVGADLLLTEILFAIIYTVAFLVLLEFIRSKDGTLRKIMIAYFCVEIFVYSGSAVYYLLVAYHKTDLSINGFRTMIVLPKVCVKLWLLWWLKTNKSK